MSVPNCFTKVKNLMKEMGKTISDERLREMAQVLSEERTEALSPADFEERATELFKERLKRDANEKRAAKIINLQVIEQARSVVGQEIKGMNIVDKVNGWVLGNSRRIGEAMNLSVPNMEGELSTRWLKKIRAGLTEIGEHNVAESGLLTKEITQELANFEGGGTESVSGSERAFKIAKVYNAVLAESHEVKQAHNPFLDKILDYFHRASHDRVKISAVPRAEWVEFAMTHYGEKSYPELTPESKVNVFGGAYDQMVRGTYETMLNFNADPSDVMQRMSKERTLIPNNWESFHAYNQRFGKNNVHTSILSSLQSAAHDVALIQKFGAKPGDAFDGVMKSLVKNGSAADIELLKASRREIEDNFALVTQKSQAPATSQKAKFMRGFLGLQQVAKNSASFLRSWADLANATTRISDDLGGNYLSNFVEAASEYVKFFGSSQEARLRASEDMGLFSKSALHNLYQELGEAAPLTTRGDKIQGGLSTLLEVHSHITGMQRHMSALDAAMSTIISRRLGELAASSFEKLPVEAVQGLKRYGIGKPQWEVIRRGIEDWSGAKGIDKSMGDVSRMLTIEGIQTIPDGIISDYLKEMGHWKGAEQAPQPQVIRARSELMTAMGAMVNDHANAASSTAGLSERAWMYGNIDKDSWKYQGLSMLYQFKSAVAKNYDTIIRSYYSNPAKPQGDFTKIARHTILASGLYAMGETAKQLFEGKTPEDPLHPGYIAKAIFNSGAGGIIGDSLISELSRSESAGQIAGGVLKSFAGPGFSTATDVAGVLGQLGYSMIDHRVKFPGSDMGRLITQNLPFQNLFYTKAAFNYYLTSSIQDWMAPGYVARKARHMHETPSMTGGGQEYFMFDPMQ